MKRKFTIAGTMYIDMFGNKRKAAFTLAEVLITLGIIGVVAILTVPNLVSNYQKKVYVAQLQKAYAQLQQVFDMAMAEDEVEDLADTELMQSINGDYIGASDDQSEFISQLGKYMKIQKACNPMDFIAGCHDIYYSEFKGTTDIDIESGYSNSGSNRGGDLQIFANDGMIYYFDSLFVKNPDIVSEEECETYKLDGATYCLYHADNNHGINVDVNGKKKPNKFGRDMFRFTLDDKGQLYPAGSVSIHKYWNWMDEVNSFCDKNNAYGSGCAGRIFDEGWKMDY